MGGNTRDGSTPFSRMGKPPQVGGFSHLGVDLPSRFLALVRQSVRQLRANRPHCVDSGAQMMSHDSGPSYFGVSVFVSKVSTGLALPSGSVCGLNNW